MPTSLNTYTLTTQNYPLSASVAYNGQATSLLTFASPTPGAGAGSPVAGIPGTYVSAVTMGPHLPVQELYQWNLSWGQELWKGSGAELQYLGSHAIHLDRDFYNNSAAAWRSGRRCKRPAPETNSSAGFVLSRTTNILITTVSRPILRQRTTHGLSGQASYTWSHDLDISDNSNNGGTTMDQFNINLDYASSNWDIRNRFVAIAVYDLPKFAGSSYLMKNTLGGLAAQRDCDPADRQSPTTFTWTTIRPTLASRTETCSGLIGCICPLPTAPPSSTSIILPALVSMVRLLPIRRSLPTAMGRKRNPLYGPGFENVNASIFKDFGIWERFEVPVPCRGSECFQSSQPVEPELGYAGWLGFRRILRRGVISAPRRAPRKNSSGSSGRVLQLAGKIVFLALRGSSFLHTAAGNTAAVPLCTSRKTASILRGDI